METPDLSAGRGDVGHTSPGLAVVGAGYGRTGTFSFKLALEQLGLGPCYHQIEVWNHPAHREMWVQAVDGGQVDWRRLLAGFRSTCDWPACSFWKQIRAAHPHAKVVLLRRDPDAWYDSLASTILEMLDTTPLTPEADAWRFVMRKLIIEQDLGGRTDRASAVATFRRYEADVRAAVPAGELLVYEVGEGWEPLCSFLGVEVPDAPFPRTNSTPEFRVMFGLDRRPAPGGASPASSGERGT